MATQAVITPIGISSFLTLKEPRTIVEGGEPRYSLTLIFDKTAQNTEAFRNLEEAIENAIKIYGQLAAAGPDAFYSLRPRIA